MVELVSLARVPKREGKKSDKNIDNEMTENRVFTAKMGINVLV